MATTQDNFIFALNAFSMNKKDIFKEYLPSYDEFKNYSGLGGKETYLMPALFFTEYFDHLVELGYPVSLILESFEVPVWLMNEQLLERVIKHNKKLVLDVIEDDSIGEYYIDDRNWEITLDYFDMNLAKLMDTTMSDFFNLSEEQIEQIKENIKRLTK